MYKVDTGTDGIKYILSVSFNLFKKQQVFTKQFQYGANTPFNIDIRDKKISIN